MNAGVIPCETEFVYWTWIPRENRNNKHCAIR